jgi:hypothetical protein
MQRSKQMPKGKATLIAQSHGVGGSSADYLLDPPLGGGYLAVKEVRVSCNWATKYGGVQILALPSLRMLRGTSAWEHCETIMADLGYEADLFPLRNNKYLSVEYRESRGWA